MVREGASVPDRSERPALPVAADMGRSGERRRTARRADPPRRPRRPGADDRRPLLDKRLGRPAAAARSGPSRRRDRAAALAGRDARRVPPRPAGAAAVVAAGARRVRRTVGPVHHRPAHRGGRPGSHVGRPRARARPRATVGVRRPGTGAARRSDHRHPRPSCGARAPARPPSVGAGVLARRSTPRPAPSSRCRRCPTIGPRSHPSTRPRLDDDVDLAVRQLVEPWLASSNGQLDVACVEGDVAAAIGAIGVRRARVAMLPPATALAWIAWAGASGGAHGRRRGRRPVGSARGGCWRRSATSPTSGRCHRTTSASWRRS